MNPTLTRNDLQVLSSRTLAHYDQRAEEFWLGTRDHDVSQNVEALLQQIEGEPPFTILDLGCGPGRDLRVFAELGYIAVGLDGAPRFVAVGRGRRQTEVVVRLGLGGLPAAGLSASRSHCWGGDTRDSLPRGRFSP